MESSDITADNNNILDKSKNGNMSPEPDTNTLYSNGETLRSSYRIYDVRHLRFVQVDRLRCSL